MFWNFRKKKPTTLEVMNAIFDQVFTPEELESMRYVGDWALLDGENVGFNEKMISFARIFRPKYSIKKSVRLTKKFVDPRRDNLVWARCDILTFFLEEIFEEIKKK